LGSSGWTGGASERKTWASATTCRSVIRGLLTFSVQRSAFFGNARAGPIATRAMKLILPAMVLVTAATGCRIATEYVPTSSGKAALGMHRGELGVYKNGVFMKLSKDVTAMLACSAPAATAASSAVDHHASYTRNTMISSVFYALAGLAPPLGVVGAVFGVQATHHWYRFSALTVDAVNIHNDTAACTGAVAVAPVAGARP
jgi:hypothetical protein